MRGCRCENTVFEMKLAKQVREAQLVAHIIQASESLTRRFRRANAKAVPSFDLTRLRPIVPEATKGRAGIVLPDACAALGLAIRVATLLDRVVRLGDVENTVAILVRRTLRVVTIEVLALFRRWWGRIVWL